ncbi:MAG: family 78 glycoside hydrolase catalytic domain [Armatimonadota bacterium]
MDLDARWIWADEEYPNAYCHLRRTFECDEVAMEATLRISADTSYVAWINGRFVGRGPGPYVRETRPVDAYDVTDLLRPGTNVICVLGHWWGKKSHSRPKGRPGVLAELSWEDAEGETHALSTDESWRTRLSTAWAREVPQRSGAVAWTEYYDAREEPERWLEIAFDASDWSVATANDIPDRHLFPRRRPLLRETREDPMALAGAWWAADASPELAEVTELTEFLDEEPLEAVDEELRAKLAGGLAAPGSLTLDALPDDRGLALTLDLGREIVGHIDLDIEAPEGARIDLAPAELLREGRPWCFRKGCRYAQRYTTRAGRQRWHTFAWHGLRYLHVVVRGCDGPLTIHRLGVRRREADLDWRAELTTADADLQQVWDITKHTLEVGTQEVHVDCPTREQAAYWGDAAWIGLWTLGMTGDGTHLRHLLLSAEPAQYDNGQLPASIFSSLDQILLDYTLIMPWALRDWWWYTGDLAVPRRLSGVVERVLDWYRERIGESGLVEIDAVAMHERREATLFIDHPGLGWHNFPHPGLDRRGISAGLNLFMLRALQSDAELAEARGDAARMNRVGGEAEALARNIEHAFFDRTRGVYADALVEGEQSEQVSQQINALAILTGVCPPERRRTVLETVLSDDPDLCRCSSYFWIYLFEAMAMAGMHAKMLEAIRTHWGGMARAGATTWWETFGGDELDSLCHPWSCAPGAVLQRHLLGVRASAPGFTEAVITPRIDLLAQLAGTMETVRGKVSVDWEATEADAHVTVSLPEAIRAEVVAPAGWQEAGGGTETSVPEGGSARVRFMRD